MGQIPVPLFPLLFYKGGHKMPLNDIINEAIAKLTKRIDELKTQISELKTQTSELDTKYTTTYNTSVSLADAIAK